MVKKKLLLFVVMLLPMVAHAYDAYINGIYYSIIPKRKVAEVTSGDVAYEGDIDIPSSFEKGGITYSVTSIGEWAFQYCRDLTSVTIPNSVTEIGDWAFEDCSKIADFYCYAENLPTLGKDVFKDAYIEYATLHVPASSLDAYKPTEPWSSFGNKVALSDEELIEDGVAEVKANPVLIQSQNGQIFLQGMDDNTPVAVYTIGGIEVGSAVSSNGSATISTRMNQGEAAIVKIGKRSVKVLVK